MPTGRILTTGADRTNFFTLSAPSHLYLVMDDNAFMDYLEARQRALEAVAGYFTIANVPTESLRVIVAQTTDQTIALAARSVLWHRGELDEA